jgi:hypothetical protein
MPPRLLIAIVLCGLPAGAELRAEEPEVKQEEITELGEQMEQMGSAFRRLRRQAAEPAYNESSLELVAVMQHAAKAAWMLVPAKAAELPEAERAEFIADYRARIAGLRGALEKLAEHLRTPDNPAAVKLIAELADLQKAGHREFRKRERD